MKHNAWNGSMITSTEKKFYDRFTRKHVASYKFIKSKSKYFVKYVEDYLHDDVYVDDIAQFKQDKGYMTYDELGQENLFNLWGE